MWIVIPQIPRHCLLCSARLHCSSIYHTIVRIARTPAQLHPTPKSPTTAATMKRNLVIFVIIISLFSVIAIIGYLIYRLQSRVGFARPTASESEQSEA
ncbi:hypothetical protein IWX90DRAFT_482661 [Phyllosticta citrichinensis]|uniref:Uncharacterized protein n=1 Tax=Phyllosticta citrichinensis TaxID=1130410 RepID=A0ABR1Y6Z5_9PEZI